MLQPTVHEMAIRQDPRFRTLNDEQLLRRHKRYADFSLLTMERLRVGHISVTRAIAMFSRSQVRLEQVVRELVRRYP